MKLIVQKFGGTSVGSIDRIRNVAKILMDTQKRRKSVVGVVSAMSGETNRLVDLAMQINPQPWSLEYDMLLASGEQIASALVALAINSAGGRARPFLAHQLGIRTDKVYSKARIREIKTERLLAEIKRGVIPIVAGFQGVDEDDNITTLGRGGSDTSAVAIAAALDAEDCDIFTDVDGVYTTDPRVCPRAKKINTISYEEMMELAGLGAKVLQIRSVELAAKYKVPLHVRSSFQLISGTRVVGRTQSMEDVLVSGIAADSNDARITISGLPDRAGVAYEIFGPLADASVVVDVIVQTYPQVSVSFTAPEIELPKVLEVLKKKVKPKFPGVAISSEKGLAKVSIVGVGMRNHPGVAAKMFRVLSKAGIDIKLISTSEIKVSVLISRDHMKKAVRKLHTAFGLDG